MCIGISESRINSFDLLKQRLKHSVIFIDVYESLFFELFNKGTSDRVIDLSQIIGLWVEDVNREWGSELLKLGILR
jgi:hypothetical protein